MYIIIKRIFFLGGMGAMLVNCAGSAGEEPGANDPGVNHKPVLVQIKHPSPGETLSLSENTQVNLSAIAFDLEDGKLTGANLKWYSGSITSAFVPFTTGEDTLFSFSPGVHTLILLAYDKENAYSGSNIQFTLVDDTLNQPPLASIILPTLNSTVSYGDPLEFSGSAIDPEDGAINGPSLIWSSNINGRLGTGETINCSSSVGASDGCQFNLAAGTHTIRLLAKDSGFLDNTDEIQLTVLPPDSSDLPPLTLDVDNIIDRDEIVRGFNLPDSVSLSLGAQDDKGIAAYLVQAVSKWKPPLAPTADNGDWINLSPVEQTFSRKITYHLPPRSGNLEIDIPLGANVFFYVWFKDTAGQLSVYAADTIRYQDVVAPDNTSQNVVQSKRRLANGLVEVSLALSGSDNWGVDGYLVSEDAIDNTPPDVNDSAWHAIAESRLLNDTFKYALSQQYPLGYNLTLRVWLKDAAGNISNGVRDVLTITSD